ncbi:MAG: hypothetical protein R3C17_12870 [Planctomycetaceae bacterium]
MASSNAASEKGLLASSTTASEQGLVASSTTASEKGAGTNRAQDPSGHLAVGDPFSEARQKNNRTLTGFLSGFIPNARSMSVSRSISMNIEYTVRSGMLAAGARRLPEPAE